MLNLREQGCQNDFCGWDFDFHWYEACEKRTCRKNPKPRLVNMVTSWSRRNSEKKNHRQDHPSIHPLASLAEWLKKLAFQDALSVFFQKNIRSFDETSTCKAIFWPEHVKIYHLTHNPSLARLTAIPCRTAAPSFSQMTRRCPSFAWNAGCVVFFAKALVVGFGRYLVMPLLLWFI